MELQAETAKGFRSSKITREINNVTQHENRRQISMAGVTRGGEWASQREERNRNVNSKRLKSKTNLHTPSTHSHTRT